MLALTAAAAVLSLAGVANGLNQALCGAHGLYLKSETGQSPCDIAALLKGHGAKPAITSFPELVDLGIDRYPAPSASEADDLTCNPVFYQLVSACGACQASTLKWVTWSEWTANCKSVTGSGYIATVMPYDIALPNYALLHPAATSGTFNPSIALAIHDAKTPDPVFNSRSELSAVSAFGNCDAKIPAIVGGTLGGIILILLALLTFVAWKGKTRKEITAGQGELYSVESQDTIMRQKAAIAGATA